MTKRLVVFLRGINVGGNRTVAMPALRSLVEELGYTDVATYINSGNLVVGTTRAAAAVTRELEQVFADTYGFPIPVMSRTPRALRQVLEANPFPEGDPKQVTVGFVAGRVPAGAAERIAALATPEERFELRAGEVFVDFAGGLGRSKLAAALDKAVGAPVTARNVRTVEKVLALAEG